MIICGKCDSTMYTSTSGKWGIPLCACAVCGTKIFVRECRAKGCKVEIRSDAIVCDEHSDHRCPVIVSEAWDKSEQRRCRNMVRDGSKCWRHREG